MTLDQTRHVLAARERPLRLIATGGGTGITTINATRELLRRSASPLRMISGKRVRDLGRVARGLVEARRVVRAFGPDVVLSTDVAPGAAAGQERPRLVAPAEPQAWRGPDGVVRWQARSAGPDEVGQLA